MKLTTQAIVILIIVTIFGTGMAVGYGLAPKPPEEEQSEEVWTCSMHPQVRNPGPGSCPICGMDLTLIAADAGERSMQMSAAGMKLAEILVAPVERRFVSKEIRLVGKVAFDETRMRDISARVAGRLDRLFVDYTGIRVREGDHLVSMYSPELRTAQTELLQAKQRLAATSGEASQFLAESNRRAYETARDKLILWGLTPGQVDEIETRGHGG